MNHEVNEENKKKRLKLYYGLLITVLCIIGVSFAWFRLYLSQSEDNTIASRTCLDVSLVEENAKIEIVDAYSIKDSEGLEEVPFTFTLKNNCDSYTKAYITIDSEYRTSSNSSYLNDGYMKVNVSTKDTTDSTSFILDNLTLTDLEDSRKGYIVKTTYLKPNEEKSYDLRIWIDEAVTVEQGLNKSWAGKIVVLSEASKEAAPEGWYSAGDDTLLAALRDNNIVTDPLTTPGKQTSDKKIYNPIDFDSAESKTADMTELQDMQIVYGTGYKINDNGLFDLTGDNIVTDTYANIYANLEGKYFIVPEDELTEQLTSMTTDLPYIYYAVEATASSMTVKFISFENLTYETVSEDVLASTEDDYGTSYYFRGAVKNNYVEFANKCWRIVRITGDGSIKLVLHNDNAGDLENPCSSANNSDTAAFAYGTCNNMTRYNTYYGDNSYIGFMYGNKPYVGNQSNFNSIKINPTFLDLDTGLNYNEWKLAPYEYTHKNLYNSRLLDFLEYWYERNNLADYDDYLADTIWCNDKSTVKNLSDGTTFGTGLGYSKEITLYGAFNRIYGINPDSYVFYNKLKYASPSFKCPNDNNGGKLSKFTVDDNINGNGNLKYRAGLLTADEVAFAGAVGNFGRVYNPVDNETYYLYENTGTNNWWTLSPLVYRGSEAYMITVESGAILDSSVTDSNYLRPSLALNSSTKLLSGTGTSEDPYVITKFVKGKNYACSSISQ